ncbi:MAG TPA: hypothetical protein VHE30_21180 [Polyangiaceae bacterium]|nr:hypothetical protein [Polyangiaceae bacterium]
MYTSDETKAEHFERYGFDGAFTRKGDDESLVQQIAALFRMTKLRELARVRSSKAPVA